MDLRLLGPLEVRLGDRPIELGPRKQRAVLAMLALEPGRTVSTDHLAEGLWGDEPPPSGAKMVQLYVSHLRRLLDGDGVRIVTRGRGYELQLLDGEVDATRVERLLGESRAREALALWRGEPLADLADEPFAAASIRRLEELRLRATEMAIDADLEAGRHGELIGELEALVSANPLSERLHAQRMLALYHAGRQSEALDAYRAARATLVEEIGVEPGADLRRLHEAILTQDPELDLPAPAVPAAALRPLPRRRSRAVLAGAAAILLAGVTAFGVIRLVEPDSLPGIDEDHVGVIDPDGGGISAEYAVGRAPGAIAAGAGSLWVANRLDGTVSRIDRGRDEVVTIPVGGAPSAVAFGAGSLWVADGDARSVAQVDPGANKVQQRIPVGNAPRSLAVGAGALWVASGVDGRVQRIDLDRARVSRSIQIGANPTALVVGAGALWVASEEAGTVTRIEPRTGRVVGALNVGNGPTALAAGEGAIWVVNRRDGLLSRIDPARNAVAWADRVGQDPIGVAVGAGSVWVAGGNDGTVIRADPRRPGAVDRIQTGSGPAAIAVADGSVWTSALAPEAAHRGGTLRVVMSNGVGINWLNPNAYGWSTAMIPLAYDGLVAYRRVDGAAGATLVAALATTVPAPSADGRTYVFTLRPGLRYSDGRPVRPEDFRASMERLLRVNKDAPPLYAGIVGAPRCMRRPARCDLSRGIETDPVARTISVHLREPDSDFLHKLTLVFAAVVPADSSASRSPGLAPPGTGPYRVAAWDARRGGVLVRNPHFRSSGDRPAGFADRIEVSIRSRAEAGIAAVQQGAADLFVVANQFATSFTRERLAALAAQAPGRVHSDPVPTTEWMSLNVTLPPFDDLRVRQALNLATDRAALVRIAGGADVAAPACQVLPPAFPGYRPYCPYSANPAPGRGWTAPDLERARSLVAVSGTRGDRVVVRVPGFERAVGSYFARLLDDLGFRARLRVDAGDYFGHVFAAAPRVQMAFVGWEGDYISPSTFIEAPFTCSARGDPKDVNLSRLCDRSIARGVRRARATPSTEAGDAWAAIDRRVMDLALVVPMTNRRMVVLVSKRAGNVENHAQWGTLLDQMWVR